MRTAAVTCVNRTEGFKQAVAVLLISTFLSAFDDTHNNPPNSSLNYYGYNF